MHNKKKTAARWLCIAIALMIISMIGASLVQINLHTEHNASLGTLFQAGYDCDNRIL